MKDRESASSTDQGGGKRRSCGALVGSGQVPDRQKYRHQNDGFPAQAKRGRGTIVGAISGAGRSTGCSSFPAQQLRLIGPFFLGLARDSGRRWVLDFQPTNGSARAIRRAEALRHDALAAEGAGLLEDDRSIACVVLVEDDALTG